MERPDFAMADYLYAASETAPDQPCFIFPDQSARSFRETEARVCRLASALTREGVCKGDRVAILATDSAGYAETLFACTLIGAVFTPLNNRLRAEEIQTLLEAAEPTVVFTSSRYLEIVGKATRQIGSIRLLIDYDGSDDAVMGYEELLEQGDESRPAERTTDDDMACLVFTSGTTGMPKGVLHSYRSLKTTMDHAPTNFELRWDGCGYTGAPYFHVAGYGNVFANLVTRNATLILPQFDPETVLKCIGQGYVRHCVFVPTMISMLLNHPDCETTSFDGLGHIIYGASPMAPDLLRRAMKTFGCDFVQLFGAGTEAGIQLILSSGDHRRALEGEEHLLNSVGRPSLSVRMRLVDQDGEDVAPGEIGEIVTRSDQTMIGYLNQQEETARTLRDGWFWGGDLGTQDADGYVYLAGRSKDMIIRGGENIYPLEIETVLSSVPGVQQIAVLGEPDAHWGEIVIACLVVDETFEGEETALAVCREKLATYKLPERIELLREMPLTGSGKISKPTLREAGRDGRAERFGRHLANV